MIQKTDAPVGIPPSESAALPVLPAAFERVVVSGIGPPRSIAPPVTQAEVLACVAEDPVIVVGDPGLGKTTWLHEFARRSLQTVDAYPVEVDLGHIPLYESLDELISDALLHAAAPEDHRRLFLFDSLDQVPLGEADSVRIEIEKLLRASYEGARSDYYILACRTTELPAELADRTVFRLLPLTGETVQAGLGTVFGPELGWRIYNRTEPSVRGMLTNPLNLHMFVELCSQPEVELAALPRNQARLYGAFVTKVMSESDKWSTREGIDQQARRQALQRVAFMMCKENVTSISPEEFDQYVQERLEEINKARLPQGLRGIELRTLLHAIRRDGFVQKELGRSVSFFHQALQEYFAACEVRQRKLEGDFLADAQWEEVLVFLSGLKDQSNNLVRKVLERGDPRLAARCVRGAHVVSRATRIDVASRLAKTLGESEPWETYEAIEWLGETGRSVLIAFAKTGTAVIRRRAVFALGLWRVEGVAGELAALLTSEKVDAHTKYHIIRALGELRDSSVANILGEALRESDPNIVALAGWALVEVGAAKSLAEALVAYRASVQSPEELLERLLDVLETEDDPEIRAHAASAVGSLGLGGGRPRLTHAFGKERSEYAKSRLAIAVAQLSGEYVDHAVAEYLRGAPRRWAYNFIFTLEKRRDTDSKGYMAFLREHPDPGIRRYATETMIGQGFRSVENSE